MEYLEFKGNISRLTFIQESFERLSYILIFLFFTALTFAFIGVFNNDIWEIFVSGEWIDGFWGDTVTVSLIIWTLLDIIPLQIARARNIGIAPFYVISYLSIYTLFWFINVFDNEPIYFIFNLIILSFEVSLFIFPGMGNQEEE